APGQIYHPQTWSLPVFRRCRSVVRGPAKSLMKARARGAAAGPSSCVSSSTWAGVHLLTVHTAIRALIWLSSSTRGSSAVSASARFIVSPELIGVASPEGRAADLEGVGDVLGASASVQGLCDKPSDLGVAALACLPEFSKRPLGHSFRTYYRVAGALTGF